MTNKMYFIDQQEHEEGLNWFVAGLFIVTQLAGGGIVAMPTALIQSGLYTGIFLNIMLLGMAASTSIMLGKCWVMLRRRWPHIYRDRHCREPYPEMCSRALGPNFRKLASITIQISQFTIAVVFMLLSSKNIQHFLKAFFRIDFSFCLLILILAFLIVPFTLLKSPEDFWWVGVISAFTTTFAVILICIGSVLDSPQCYPKSVGMPPHFHPTNYFLALGTFLFAYGGHPGFPTVQHDMKRPEEFTKSSILAFLILALLYLPTCLLGYFIYGNSLRESIMNSMQHIWIQHAASFLITGHAIFSVIIVINPLNQSAEKKFDVPQEFGLKRLFVRGAIFLLVIFVAESIPTFGPLLDLSGGSTQTITALILPCICYLFLKVGEQKAINRENAINQINDAKRMSEIGIAGLQFYSSKIYDENLQIDFNEPTTISDVLALSDRKVLFLCIFIIAFGLLGGGAATFSAIRELTFTHFVPPCYISPFLKPEIESSTHMGTINCCGPGQNISIHGNSEKFCSKPDYNFYE